MTRHSHRSLHNGAPVDIKGRNIHLIRLMLLFLIGVLLFLMGFLLRGNSYVLSFLGLDSFSTSAESQSSPAVETDTSRSLSARVAEVEEVLESESLEELDLDIVTNAVMNALTSSAGDDYLRYFDEARYELLMQEASGTYAGIGVLFSEEAGRAYAVDVFEGSAAQAAGVEVGDIVLSIDGDRGADWSLSEVVAAIDADTGSQVVITWQRGNAVDEAAAEEFTTTLDVSDYTVQNVEIEVYDKVGYISLHQVSQNAASLIQEALDELTASEVSSIVLDLRSNPGGYLTQAVDVASLFIKSGVVVQVTTVGGVQTAKNATGNSICDLPMVVLVNNDTAAAAEVIAVALQDNARATIVGTTTSGKGSVQIMRELSFGGALRYTAAYYESPLGQTIEGKGISPDISIALSSSSDNQKSVAIETAQSLAGD